MSLWRQTRHRAEYWLMRLYMVRHDASSLHSVRPVIIYTFTVHVVDDAQNGINRNLEFHLRDD